MQLAVRICLLLYLVLDDYLGNQVLGECKGNASGEVLGRPDSSRSATTALALYFRGS